MPCARVTDKDFLDLHLVTTVVRTRVDRMAVVDAAADRVLLNDSDTHRDKDCSLVRDSLSKAQGLEVLMIISSIRGTTGFMEAALKTKE